MGLALGQRVEESEGLPLALTFGEEDTVGTSAEAVRWVDSVAMPLPLPCAPTPPLGDEARVE